MDTFTDYPADPGCSSLQDNNERGTAICDNGVDETNDNDTLADYPSDPGCTGPSDGNEQDGQCDDQFDNEFDGVKDYPTDPECSSGSDLEGNCADSDGGLNTNTTGTVTGSSAGTPYSLTDVCVNSTSVTEYFCNGATNEKGSANLGCGVGKTCVSGACV